MTVKQASVVNMILGLSVAAGVILAVAHVITRETVVLAGVPVIVVMIVIGQRYLKRDPNNFYSRMMLGKTPAGKQSVDAKKL